MNITNNNSYLADPLAKLRQMQNEVDLLYAGYNYRQDQRELAKGQDIKTKYDKNENPTTKNQYHTGAVAQNFLGNTAKYGALAMSFVKDKETANNTVNDAATSVRKTAQQALLSTGNPIAMAIGATSMLSDKVGGTASATKGLGLGNDIGNFVASQVPFLGFAGADMGKQFQSDELSGSSMYTWNSTADGLFGGKVLFGKGKAKNLTQTNNMQRSLATNILKDAKLDFIGAQDPRYYIAAQNELNGGYDQVGRAKQGRVLQFTKQTLSKYKIKKRQSGGPIDLDAEYLKQIKDKNFLQDWNPDEESFRSYVEKRQTRDENDQLIDGNIYNNLYYFDITQDDYDMGKDQYLFFYDGSPYSFTDLADARKAYNQMTPQEKRQFYINGMERSIRSGQFFQKGGQIKHKQTARTLDELVDYVEQQNPPFWERMSGQDKNEIPSPFGDDDYSTLLMSWSTGDNGMAEVYPQVQYDNTTHHLKYIQDWREALDLARKNGDVIIMTPEEAENFTTNYKKASKLKHLYDSILPQYTETFTGIFKEGGKVNVIPEGALHKNKHHLEDLDDKFGKDAITTKGIPVVVEAKDGEVIQQAEVERQEIIFRLEVTKKLEELSKEHTDEAAIEAGKLLVQEILYNTIDNTKEMI